MARVRVEIVRYTDDAPPGWVECRLTDLTGRVWLFEEKAPVVADAYLDAASPYPLAGSVYCAVLQRGGEGVRVGVGAIGEYFECVVPTAVVMEEPS